MSDNAIEMAAATADIAAQLGETKSYAIKQIEGVVGVLASSVTTTGLQAAKRDKG
jgi:hypothetical protein